MKVNQTWQFRGGRQGGINRTDDLRVNWTWQFEGKSDLAISGGQAGGVNHTDDLRVNLTWRFEGKSDLAISGVFRRKDLCEAKHDVVCV